MTEQNLIRTMEGLDYSFVDNRYQTDDGCIVDIGCLNWDWSNMFLKNKRVIGVDPQEKNIPEGAELFSGVIGPFNGRCNIYGVGEGATLNGDTDGYEIEMVSWKTFCQKFNINNISILKINIEGAEYPLLNSMETDDFEKIDQIAISFHNWLYPKQCKLTEASIFLLETNGFKVQKIQEQYNWWLATKNFMKITDIQPNVSETIKNYKGDFYRKFFEFDEVRKRHDCGNVVSCSLFNSDVNNDSTDIKELQDAKNDREFFEKKYMIQFRKLVDWFGDNLDNFRMSIFIEKEFKDLEFLNREYINLYVMKEDSPGALGMYWRFLPISDERIHQVFLTDIDILDVEIENFPIQKSRGYDRETELDSGFSYSLRNFSTRIGCSTLDEDFTINRNISDAKFYPLMGGGSSSIRTRDIDFDITTSMCQYLEYQEKDCCNEPKTVYNQLFGISPNGFGNNVFNYASDERYLSKVMYYYLTERGLLHSFKTPANPNQKELLVDYEHCIDNNNPFVWF